MPVTVLSPAYSRTSPERGQTLILWVLAFSVILVVAAIVVDVGLWVSERYGAQNDGDFSALAGAQAYLADINDTSTAFDDAKVWAIANGVLDAEIDAAPSSNCSAGNSCIDVGTSNCRGNGDTMPWVEARIRHPGTALFSSIFSVVDRDIGAIARACVGSPRTRYDLSPFGVQTGFVPPVGDPETDLQCQNDTDDDADGEVNDGCPLSSCLEPDPADPARTRPVYGRVCILKTGAQGGVSGQRGQLTIGDLDCQQTSASTLRHDFHYGARAGCTMGQEVNTGTGNIIGLLSGLNDRLVEEGHCDDLFFSGNAGYDDFDEVLSITGGSSGPIVPSADNIFAENPCHITNGVDGTPPDSYDPSHVHTYLPRAVHLILIDELQQGQQTATITGFAGFYVIGCYKDAIAYQKKLEIEQDLSNIGPYLNRCDSPNAKDDILGIFVQTLAPPENVGNPDPNLPLSIVLVK